MAKQSEVESLKSSVSEGKSLIASAITDKGVSTSSTATFQTMATNIGKINEGMPTLITKSALGTASTYSTTSGTSADGMYITYTKSGSTVSFTFNDPINNYSCSLGSISLTSSKFGRINADVIPDCSSASSASNIFYLVCAAISTGTQTYSGYRVYKYNRSNKSATLDKSQKVTTPYPSNAIPANGFDYYLGYAGGVMYGLKSMIFYKFNYSSIGSTSVTVTKLSGGPGYGDALPLRAMYINGSTIGMVMENRLYQLGNSYNTFSTSNVIYDQYNGAIYSYSVSDTLITATKYSPTGNSWSTLGTIPINRSGYARGSNFTVHGVTPTHIIFSYTPSSGGNKLYRIYRFSGTALEYFWRADSGYYSGNATGIYYFGQTKASGKSGMEFRYSDEKYVNEYYMPGIGAPITSPVTTFKYYGSTASTSYPTIVD